MKSLFTMSRFGLIAYGVFITSVLLMTILVPYGDQPDFEIRLERLQNEQLPKSDLHHYINFFPEIKQGETCTYESGSKSIWAKISLECIELNLGVVPYKLLHVLLITFPIFFLAVFRKQVYQLFFPPRSEQFVDWERKVDATILGILLPSAVYSFSFVSQEVFSYSLLSLLLIVSRNLFLVGLLLFWIFNLDFGDFLVASMFLSFRVLLMAISKKFGVGLAVWCAGILIFSAFALGEVLLKHLVEMNIQSKFSEVYSALISKEAYENYPLLLRPVITIMSLVFMTATGIKSIALYAFWSMLTAYLLYRVYRHCSPKNNVCTSSDYYTMISEKKMRAFIGFLAMITTIFFIVLIAPTHTNAKYYIFMMPFAVYPLLYFFNRYTLLYIILFSSLILYLNIVFYYIS